MAHARATPGDPGRTSNAIRAFASTAAALICTAAAESSEVLVTRLLTDGAAMTTACGLARLIVWMARELRRAARNASAA